VKDRGARSSLAGRLLGGGEPFRLFFPAGLLASLVGAALWPLHFAGIGAVYPGPGHARIMLFSFFGAFVVGFLGTAGPRMLEAKPLRGWEVGLLLLGWLGAFASYATGRLGAGDAAVLATAAGAGAMAAARIRARRSLPPPTFGLVVLGLFAAVGGLALQMGAESGLVPGPATAYQAGKLWLQEGFLVLMILGVAPFFFPRFGGRGLPQGFWKEGPAWRRAAAGWAFLGAGYLALLSLEAIWPELGRMWRMGRVAIVVGYAWRRIPFRFPAASTGSLGRIVQVALLLGLAGLAVPVAYPEHGVAWFHLLGGGGYGLVTLSVGTWVCFGHAGRVELGLARSPLLWTATGLLLLSLATRVYAELDRAIWDSHVAYAGAAWAAGAALWAAKILPWAWEREKGGGGN